VRQRDVRLREQAGQTFGDARTVVLPGPGKSTTQQREPADHLPSGIVVYEATAGGEDFVVRDCDPAAARIEGTTPQRAIGRPVAEAFPSVRESGLLDILRRVRKTGRAERRLLAPIRDGRPSIWPEVSVYRLASGLIVAVYDDVTERRRAEEDLSRFRLLATEARDIMLFVRVSDGAIVHANAAAESAYGYSREELLRLDIGRLRAAGEGPLAAEHVRAAQAEGILFETEHRRKDGSTFSVEVSSRGTAMVNGDKILFSVIRDISERKRAEDALRKSEERYRILAEASPDLIYIIDRHDRVQYVNSRGAGALGRSPEDLVGVRRADLFEEDTEAHMSANLRSVFVTGEPLKVESQWTFPSGSQAWIATWLVPIKDDEGRVSAVFGVSRDISDRAAAEQAAAERSHFLEELLEAIPVPVFYKDTGLHYLGCNSAFADIVGCSKDDVTGGTVFDVYPMAVAERIDAADREALAHSGRAVEYELQTPGADGTPRIVATHKAAFSDVVGAPAGIVGVDLDMTAIHKAEQELAASAVQLRLTLKAAVAALGATAEMRDPYTAGHQRRVAELACAIAAKLGWAEERIETLRTAALLHDIGKIVVPAEILSKPGRLSDTEMHLIRQHPGAGADAVAEIDFEGNVAEVIRQHHERLDGSGYPDGLRGTEVRPESRIVAVADVVEAMITHRPYRPALPVDEALAEIAEGAGSRYDADACAACISLFREDGFTITG
jgi:PAS domain S-box-containing protein/putative nucleotidyltransferase with HDIG domain